jgi:hypothetical protein
VCLHVHKVNFRREPRNERVVKKKEDEEKERG